MFANSLIPSDPIFGSLESNIINSTMNSKL
jgi:hypothetical protein